MQSAINTLTATRCQTQRAARQQTVCLAQPSAGAGKPSRGASQVLPTSIGRGFAQCFDIRCDDNTSMAVFHLTHCCPDVRNDVQPIISGPYHLVF